MSLLKPKQKEKKSNKRPLDEADEGELKSHWEEQIDRIQLLYSLEHTYQSGPDTVPSFSNVTFAAGVNFSADVDPDVSACRSTS
jgi:hypothetical protein